MSFVVDSVSDICFTVAGVTNVMCWTKKTVHCGLNLKETRTSFYGYSVKTP